MNEQELNQMKKFLDDIFATEINELQCDQAGILMAQSTHDSLSDEESGQRYPLLWTHFHFCPDCFEEYRMLDELTKLERSAQIFQLPNLPPVPNDENYSWISQIKEKIVKQFPGFQPSLSIAIQRGSSALGMEPITVTLDDNFVVQIDVSVDEEDPNYRHLLGTIFTQDDEIIGNFEGNSVLLQVIGGGVLKDEMVDELGDFAFSHINTGNYNIRMFMSEQEYVISDISVP